MHGTGSLVHHKKIIEPERIIPRSGSMLLWRVIRCFAYRNEQVDEAAPYLMPLISSSFWTLCTALM